MEESPIQPEVQNESVHANKKQSIWELVRFAIFAIATVFLIRIFIIQPFIVSGSSMVPTFENGEYLIVDEISYDLHGPKRDDVVVFKYPNDTSKFFIKRIIGLPGETVEIKGSDVIIKNSTHKEGFTLDQPYVENKSNNNLHFELKTGEYFVMGDNRSASSDSRYWGPVPEKLLVGKVLLRLWPVSRVSVSPGSYTEVQ